MKLWSCRHKRLARIVASWTGDEPPAAECPDCGEFVPWTTHRDERGGYVLFHGVRVWCGPRSPVSDLPEEAAPALDAAIAHALETGDVSGLLDE